MNGNSQDARNIQYQINKLQTIYNRQYTIPISFIAYYGQSPKQPLVYVWLFVLVIS